MEASTLPRLHILPLHIQPPTIILTLRHQTLLRLLLIARLTRHLQVRTAFVYTAALQLLTKE